MAQLRPTRTTRSSTMPLASSTLATRGVRKWPAKGLSRNTLTCTNSLTRGRKATPYTGEGWIRQLRRTELNPLLENPGLTTTPSRLT